MLAIHEMCGLLGIGIAHGRQDRIGVVASPKMQDDLVDKISIHPSYRASHPKQRSPVLCIRGTAVVLILAEELGRRDLDRTECRSPDRFAHPAIGVGSCCRLHGSW